MQIQTWAVHGAPRRECDPHWARGDGARAAGSQAVTVVVFRAPTPAGVRGTQTRSPLSRARCFPDAVWPPEQGGPPPRPTEPQEHPGARGPPLPAPESAFPPRPVRWLLKIKPREAEIRSVSG